MNDRWKDLYEQLQAECRGWLSGCGEISAAELYEKIDVLIDRHADSSFLGLGERLRLREMLFNSFRKLGELQELIDDPSITEIMINGCDRVFLEDRHGIRRWDGGFGSDERLEDLIRRIVGGVNRRVNTSEPIVDARLPDGSRVHVVLPPVALDGAAVTIRKFPEQVTIAKMLENGTLTLEAADFLRDLVRARYNIFVSGGTGSGKTTLLNALSAFIPEQERIITIEDSAELNISHIPNLVRLETRAANTEGNGQIDMAMLIKAALRMRPDRIIVGEVRDGSAVDMLNAFDTGHDGSLSTGHANSCRDMLIRLEGMVLSVRDAPMASIRRQIASAVEILVHLERMPDRSRKVVEITEITGCDGETYQLNRLFSYDLAEGKLKRTGSLKRLRKMEKAGLSGAGE